MTLLALPNVPLHDIIRETGARECSDDDNLDQRTCTPPYETCLAHTCQRLRALSLPFMYTSVSVHVQHVESLHGLLTTYGSIAGLVRQLTFFSANPGFVQAIMSQVAQQRHLSVTLSFCQWDTVIHFMSSAPRGLQTLRLTDTIIQRIMPVLSPPTPTPSPLTEVHTFACNTSLIYQKDPNLTGQLLARLIPSMQVLDLHVDEYMISLFETYADLGSRLTKLTVSFDFTPP
ncbi:hypothetical protein Q9L58_004074 [Maublancomyces gigas]|uniref:Uncharacterized protein n=1 Tax=Discina gigas TaxID=1032678 RepID=A0ABR3GN05_9PEZI